MNKIFCHFVCLKMSQDILNDKPLDKKNKNYIILYCIINIYFSYIYLLEMMKKLENYGSPFLPWDKKLKRWFFFFSFVSLNFSAKKNREI